MEDQATKTDVEIEEIDKIMETPDVLPTPPAEVLPAVTPPAAVAKVEEPEYKTTTTEVMDPIIYKQLKLLAQDMIKSGAVPSSFKNVEQLFVAMMIGREMGMTPYESLRSLYQVGGRFCVYGAAVTGRIKKFGYDIEYTNETPDSTTARVFNGTKEYKETYTYQDAIDSGYTKDNYGKEKFGWNKGINRKLKLRYGALNLIIRTYLPEVLGSAEGIVEVDEDVRVKPTIVLDEYVTKIEAAKDLDDLSSVWSALPVEIKNESEIIELKDKKKASFSEVPNENN